MIKNGWVICPKCHKKLFPLKKNTMIKVIVCRCKSCGYIFPLSLIV